MSTPLAPNELICFGFSSFDCEARRKTDEVVVDVWMFRGTYYRFTCGPNLTRAEIQELTACKILTQLHKVGQEVRGYANTVRRDAAANA